VVVFCAEPHKPGPPTNLTEGDTLIMGDKVAVTLHWFPPSHSDLPVSRYKATLSPLAVVVDLFICYECRAKYTHTQSTHKNKKKIMKYIKTQ